MLQIREVTKRYRNTLAVDSVSLAVQPGRVLGLLGPNGAGKSSILRMVTNITWPDAGEIYLDEEPVTQTSQSKIGYLPEERGLYRQMRVLDQLIYIGRLKGLTAGEARDAARNWLSRLGAEDWGSKRPRDLSRGMQQKVQFALTLVHSPRLVILDEPFSGLDPLNAQLMEDIIRQRRNAGDIILFASHLMEQVEDICDDICLISEGKVVVWGSLKEVKRTSENAQVSISFDGNDAPLAGLVKQGMITLEVTGGQDRQVRLHGGFDANGLLDTLRAAGRRIDHYAFKRPSLREVFIEKVEASRTDAPLEDAA